MNEVLQQFKDRGMSASFHYADDTASGEWRLGRIEEAKALRLFDDNPSMQGYMRDIAKGFLWSLKSVRPEPFNVTTEYLAWCAEHGYEPDDPDTHEIYEEDNE